MKILYSQIKELVPDLSATPKEVGEALTLTGFMMDSFTEISYKSKTDYLLGLEIRQNRADCLSVIGLARETAAYYGLEMVLPEAVALKEAGEDLNIKIEAKDYVKRVLAIKIDNIKNAESPDWLKEYLVFYDLNPVNMMVDLSNYIMLLTGYPSHLIDCRKTRGGVYWSLNHDFDEVVTLLGATLKLQKNKEIIIRDEEKIIALAGIVGSKDAEIDKDTDSLIVEIAVYDRSIVRKNSRNLNIVTEASHRLEKELDPTSSEYAMALLVDMIVKLGGGKVTSKLFDYFPNKVVRSEIEFDMELPSRFSGVNIPADFIKKTLRGLDFAVREEKEGYLRVMPPVYRTDVSMEEDVVEEVLRIYGYDRIPSKEIPKLEVVRDITPKNITLADKIRDILIVLGFDETMSWPLTRVNDNALVNYRDWKIVSTQNSVNDIYPDLRQSITTGLLIQLNEYLKKNVEFIDIFEIGKIFGEVNNDVVERESLGILSAYEKESLALFRLKIDSFLRQIGLNDIEYSEAASKPKIANINSCWDIYVNGKVVGIIYKLISPEVKKNIYSAEIDITILTEILLEIKSNPVVEITRKLIALDANIELGNEVSIDEYLKKLRSKINKEKLWSLILADKFPLGDKTRYTIRATYMELSDQEAKEIHLDSFDLRQ